MPCHIRSVTFDAVDPPAISAFWAEITGHVEDPDDPNLPEHEEWGLIDPAGRQPDLLFIKVPEAKTVKNRVHLDLQPSGPRDEAVAWLEGLGARLVADHRKPGGTGWVVMADPEGNEFCVLRSAEERIATGKTPPLDTGMREMPPVRTAPEREMLEAMLDWYRDGILLKVDGLSDERATASAVRSSTTIAGLVTHLALVEDAWFTERFAGAPMPEPWASADWDADRDWEFTTARTEPLSVAVGLYRAACDRSRAVAGRADLDDLCAGGADAERPFTLRWALVHLVEETARHLGHLDILGELADGRTGE